MCVGQVCVSVFEVVNERKRRNCCLDGGLTLNDGWKKGSRQIWRNIHNKLIDFEATWNFGQVC